MKKEFTEDDLRDAFEAGINFMKIRAIRGFENMITPDYIKESDSKNKLFENVLKDKRHIARL